MTANATTSAAGPGKRVAVIAGCRTPFAKVGGFFDDDRPVDLARTVLAELLRRAEVEPSTVDRVILGTVVADAATSNLAREAALAAGMPPDTDAFSVSRACASANQAIANAVEAIQTGQAEIVIAGGAESLSNVPIKVSRGLARALIRASKAKRLGQKLASFGRLRLKDLAPVPPALAEYSTGLTMGQSAERMAKVNGISREDQDRFALMSHERAAAATDDGRLVEEIVRCYRAPDYKTSLGEDDGVRRDTSLESLAALRPVFDRRFGSLTAGNSSPLSDGAAAVVLMSEERAKAEGRVPLGYVRAYAFAAVDPADQLLIGPAYSTPRALDRAGLALSDMTLVDLHEAFAAQVLSVVRALASETFCQEKLGRPALGEIDRERLNVMGGSIAIGHPFGATGARITLSLLNELRRRGGGFGLLGVCAAGGFGFSMIVESEAG